MKHIGNQTIQLDTPPTILETASIVGPKEGEGPLASYFDQCLEDEFWGEKTWEKIKENDQLKDIKVIQKGEPIFMRLNIEEEVEYLKDAMKKA